MPMALEHFVASINLLREGTGLNLCRPRSKPHAGAFVGHLALLIEQTNHWIGRGLIELGAISAGDAADIARELDRSHLHAEAKAKIGELLFAGETRRFNVSFHSAVAKAAATEHPGYTVDLTCHSVLAAPCS